MISCPTQLYWPGPWSLIAALFSIPCQPFGPKQLWFYTLGIISRHMFPPLFTSSSSYYTYPIDSTPLYSSFYIQSPSSFKVQSPSSFHWGKMAHKCWKSHLRAVGASRLSRKLKHWSWAGVLQWEKGWEGISGRRAIQKCSNASCLPRNKLFILRGGK